MTSFDRRTVNLKALNSLTKYPSIPTYHELDPRNGGLLDNPVMFYGSTERDRSGPVIATEKVDGTSTRIVLLPPEDGGYLLGSREELLYANGDLIGNPALGIVENLRTVADSLSTELNPGDDTIRVFYLELFGGKIGGQAKQYSTTGAVGWRLFDVATISELDKKLTWAPERISAWRDTGGQPFADEDLLQAVSRVSGIELTPRLFTVDAMAVPGSIENMHEFLLDRLPGTLVALDDTGKGAAEGIVMRTPGRSVIAKARFQDYERTLKRRAAKR